LWLAAAVLVLMTVLAYQPVWHAGFIWDDDTFLVDNPLIKAGDGLYRFWCTTSAPDYFPMTSTTLWLEWRLWGNHPLGYHLVNVLLHAASSVVLWRVLARLRIPGAWLAAAIFALHPVNVESVAWITERKNTLAMFFCAWTLLWYVRFDQQSKAGTVPPATRHPSPGTRPSSLFYWLSLGAFVLALLSKTAVVTLPVVLLGLVWWRCGRIERRDIWRTIPFFATAGLLGLITIWFQYHRAIGPDVVRADSFWARLAGAGWAVWFYLYKALWPLNLMFVYPRWSIDVSKPLSYLPAVLAVAVFAVGWHYRRHWGRPVLCALGCFVVMLLPVLGFLDIYFMRFSLVADHWQYFSILGPIALLAAALATAVERWGRTNRVTLGGAVLLVLGVLTWKQSCIYADEETLWQDILAKNPACWLAHNNLGNSLLKKGQADEAIGHLQEAIRLKSDYADAHNNLGNALAEKGQMDEAISQLQEAIRLKPDGAEFHYNLGLALVRKGQTDEAVCQYQEAIRLKPDYSEAHNNLGIALSRKGQMDEAIRQFQESLRLQPGDALAHFNLGKAFQRNGRIDDAIGSYQAGLTLKSGEAEVHHNLATLLVRTGRLGEAIHHFQQALSVRPDFAEAHNNLGTVFYQQGRNSEAIRQFEEALRLKPDYADARRNLDAALAGKAATQ
jgi:tetratricopeptide (TPR) repeat protein